MEQRLRLSVALHRAPGWWLGAVQEPEAAPQALSILYRDQTDTGSEHNLSELREPWRGSDALGCRPGPAGGS